MLDIVVLMDNAAGSEGTAAEHGLSFLCAFGGRKVLFDTGKSGAFLGNARTLGADLRDLDAVVISHGHYDHGGGFRPFVEAAGFAGPLWTGTGFFDAKLSADAAGDRYLGLDFDESYLQDKGIEARTLRTCEGRTAIEEIVPGLYALGSFDRIHPSETIPARFLVERDGRRLRDDFGDEVCLAADLSEGVVAVVGCAHPGLMNLLDAVRSAFRKPLLAVLGGSHLVEADGARIGATIEYLEASGCRTAALGHCTGPAAAAELRARLPAYEPLGVGASFTFDR